MPFDIIVISTHAGDVAGERITYDFVDSEGIRRHLIIDHAIGFGYDPQTDKVLVQQFDRFHELDGVLWAHRGTNAGLYVGIAIKVGQTSVILQSAISMKYLQVQSQG